MNSPTARNPAANGASVTVILSAAVAAQACLVGYLLTKDAGALPALVAAVCPFTFLILLRRPDYGLIVLVFLCPFVDVFKTSSMGVTFRLSEVFGIVMFMVMVFEVLRSRRTISFTINDYFVLSLLAAMVVSVIVNIGNLPSEVRLRNIPTAWIGVTGSLDKPQLATIKKMIQALVALAAYFAVSNLITSRETWIKAVKTLVVSSMLVCCWAFLNLIGFLGGMSEGLGMQAQNIWYSGSAPRIRGTLSEPSYFANFLLVVIPVTFFLYSRQATLLGRRLDFAAFLLLCLTLVFTFSGGGWIVFGFEIFLIFLVCLRNRVPLGKFGFTTFSLAVIAVIGLLGMAVFTDMDYARLASENFEKFASLFESGVGSGRRIAPDVGWMMFCDHPLFGVGPGRFHTFEYDYLIRLGYTATVPQSGFYANVLGELGLFGILAVSGIFGSFVISCFKYAQKTRDAVVQTVLWGFGVAFIAIAVHYLAHATFWWPYVWVAFGLATAGIRLTRDTVTTQTGEV